MRCAHAAPRASHRVPLPQPLAPPAPRRPRSAPDGAPDARANHEQPPPDSAALRLPLRFASAHAAAAGREPAWTNATSGFVGTLDYVWVATHARRGGGAGGDEWEPLPGAPRPVRALAEPPQAEVAACVAAAGGGAQGGDAAPLWACPNAVVPSDHIPVVVELA